MTQIVIQISEHSHMPEQWPQTKNKHSSLKYCLKNLSVLISPPLSFLTLFYMGFWRYVNTWGGIKTIPPIKSHQNDSNLVKRHVLAKIDYCCPLFMHLELNHYHFLIARISSDPKILFLTSSSTNFEKVSNKFKEL